MNLMEGQSLLDISNSKKNNNTDSLSLNEVSVKIDASCQYDNDGSLPSHRSLGCGDDEV